MRKARSRDFHTHLEYALESNPIKHCMASTGTSGGSFTRSLCLKIFSLLDSIFCEDFCSFSRPRATGSTLPTLSKNNTFAHSDPWVPLTTNL